jgi:hypothetical protein
MSPYQRVAHPASAILQIPLHWHFLTACPEYHAAELTRNASALWTRCYGDLQIKPYDSSREGARYIAKLASQSGFDYMVENLDRLGYYGHKDLFKAAEKNPYLPQHVKATTRYDSLVLRDPKTRLQINSRSERSNISSSDTVLNV